MKLTVLVDNNTCIDRYFLAEPALSFLIEAEDKKILFDTGYSNIFISNATKMGISLLDIDQVVISHGHIDHTGGLEPLIKHFFEATIENLPIKKLELIAHPLAFETKTYGPLAEIGSLVSLDKLSKNFEVKLTDEPVWLTDRLVFLGQVERNNNFEAKDPIGSLLTAQGLQDDFLLDDTALVYKADTGLVVIAGCSHAGICNTIEYAKKVCGEEKIVDVIGGFHLLNPSDAQLNGTVEYFKSLSLPNLHCSHCTDLRSKIELSKISNLKEVAVGLTLEYN